MPGKGQVVGVQQVVQWMRDRMEHVQQREHRHSEEHQRDHESDALHGPGAAFGMEVDVDGSTLGQLSSLVHGLPAVLNGSCLDGLPQFGGHLSLGLGGCFSLWFVFYLFM